MSSEVAFEDMEAGKYYKLRDSYQLTIEQQGNGTLQEDIDKIASAYYELEEDPEDGDARFRLPPGESVIVPYVNGVNQETGPRNYIFISSTALPDGEDTVFLEGDQGNIPIPVNTGNGNFMNNGNPMTNFINLTNSSGGRRKRRQSKKRKTLKRKLRKQTRKARKSRRRM